MNSGKQQHLLDLCFSRLYGRFNKLVGRFGGKKLEQNLKTIFLAQAKGQGFKQGGGFNVEEASIDWVDYRNLTSQLINFTAEVAGKKTVGNEIRSLVSEIEQETDESLYEIGFKLGLNQYTED
jgi:hypothetical protein